MWFVLGSSLLTMEAIFFQRLSRLFSINDGTNEGDSVPLIMVHAVKQNIYGIYLNDTLVEECYIRENAIQKSSHIMLSNSNLRLVTKSSVEGFSNGFPEDWVDLCIAEMV